VSPWTVDSKGFVQRETGERAQLGMSLEPVTSLIDVFARGACPVRPSIDEALFAEIVAHKSVVSVSLEPGRTGPRAAFTLARAVDAIINAGALAVRCRTSGLSHGADAFQALVGRACTVDPEDDATLAAALYECYVLLHPEHRPPHTVGLHALGASDLALEGDLGADRATITLEDLARRTLRSGVAMGAAAPDPRDGSDPRHNPLGRIHVKSGSTKE